jgi:hypothetical protein
VRIVRTKSPDSTCKLCGGALSPSFLEQLEGMPDANKICIGCQQAFIKYLSGVIIRASKGKLKYGKCVYCQATFIIRNKNQKCCSTPCLNSWRHEVPIKSAIQCVECNKIFQPKTTRHITCGPKCARARASRLQLEHNRLDPNIAEKRRAYVKKWKAKQRQLRGLN